MKSIIELISMMTADGSSAITDVKIRINQLMGLTESGFNIGESTSRSHEDGALTDLRTAHPLTTSDPKAIEIRRRLTLLQNNYNLIKFEEKINDETNQSTFIITDVAYPEFLNNTKINFQLPTEDMHSQEVNSVIIRTGLHNIRCSYIKVLVGQQVVHPIQDLQMLKEPPSEEDKDVITYSRNNSGDNFSIIDFIASQDQKDFHEIKSMLNQFCDLPMTNEFALYFQSSSPEFPIDLRVILDKEDVKGKNAQLKLSGFVQFGGSLIYEVKSSEDSNQIAIIIKAINKAHLEKYFTNKEKVRLEGEQLERAFALIKEHFPNDKHIQDLVIVSGEGSYTRPFPHIRTQKFWSVSMVDPKTIAALSFLEESGCIDFDQRPENRFTVEKRNNARYLKVGAAPVNFQNDNYQFIVVPKNLSLLQEKLDRLAPNTSLTFS
ncbi:hypothetical protein [Legionella bozemanae]|uniref:Uncharacterized protein n=1 Tax=Legionella bozemanae TaxID=447 RepID=A0A0W0RWG2_LEGBO|nr:hypothetical protein [Legionella bozemanae]KTC75551.1 hypothetical protein Lboz_0807 [Legionella bozemanae]STO32463.1 Uncharacterised protein [Legionella bozemanae]